MRLREYNIQIIWLKDIRLVRYSNSSIMLLEIIFYVDLDIFFIKFWLAFDQEWTFWTKTFIISRYAIREGI